MREPAECAALGQLRRHLDACYHAWNAFVADATTAGASPGSVIPPGCRPSRIASTMLGASRVRRRRRET